MSAEGIIPMMPPLPEGLPYIDWLMDAGPIESAAAGSSAIGWRTLQAWQEGTGIALEPWEARLLRRLSGDWLREAERARKPDCPAPWTGEPIEINREAVAKKVGLAFASLARRPTNSRRAL